MTTAREQAREAGKEANSANPFTVADAASDVWEHLLRRIDLIQRQWFDGDVPMNVALSEIRQIVQEALGE